MQVEWKAETFAGLFPVMCGHFVISELSKSETHLGFEGTYTVPLGVLGTVFDTAVGHRIAEASILRFVRTVAEHLSELGAQRKLSEEKVRAVDEGKESEERFRIIAEHIAEVFWLSDPALREAIYVSPAYNSIWGVTDLAPRHLPTHADEIYPEDLPHVQESIPASPKEPFEMEFRIQRPDGDVRWIRNRAFPVRNLNGAIHRFTGVAEDVTHRKTQEDALRQNVVQLRALSAKILNTREEERARISRDIHDDLGSALTCLKWDLEWLLTTAGHAIAKPLKDEVCNRLASMVALTAGTMASVRRIAADLRPPLLDDFGLPAAVEAFLEDLRLRTGMETSLRGSEALSALSPAQTLAVYQIVIEALTNVMRHAEASKVEINCWHSDREVCVSIADNGSGIPEPSPGDPPRLGLLGMRERAGMSGGSLDVSNLDGRGTHILLRLNLGKGTDHGDTNTPN